MTTNTGGPAFPQEVRYITPNGQTGSHGPRGGMTLRDYFAAKAMQALLTKCGPYGEDMGKPYSEDALDIGALAAYAYLQADEMLKAREA